VRGQWRDTLLLNGCKCRGEDDRRFRIEPTIAKLPAD
jgi:hypothetical protein